MEATLKVTTESSHFNRVGQNRISDDFPAKNTVYLYTV